MAIMDLTTIIDAPWRGYPAAALALYGLVLLGQGLWFGFRGSGGLLRERDALGWMRGFRLAVVGLCMFGIAVAWVWQLFWLFVVSVGIVGEELLETTVIIEVLKRNPPPAASGRVTRSGEPSGRRIALAT
jgi:hypothetical protein